MELVARICIKPEAIQIGEILGEGTFGQVNYGKWQGLDVAVKQLKTEKLTGRAQEEFIQEASTMMSLRAPYIVSLYGITLEPPAMVLEYLSGGSLDQWLHGEDELDWNYRYSLALDIAKGLSYLHSQNIVHRDLKSLNILLDEHGRAKLCDFGLARVKSESTKGAQTKTLQGQDYQVGTELWMAPELLNPQTARYTAKSDMYSYGVILWEIAAREYPYQQARGSFALIRSWKEQGQEEAVPEGTPAYFSKAIDWCRSLDPAKRPAASELIKYLEEVTEEAQTGLTNEAGMNTASASMSGFIGNLGSQMGAAPGNDNQYAAIGLGTGAPAGRGRASEIGFFAGSQRGRGQAPVGLGSAPRGGFGYNRGGYA